MTADIKRVTVQQDVTWGSYQAAYAAKEPPPGYRPSPDTPGVLVEVQVQLSGYMSYSYSANQMLVSPKTHVELINLTSNWNACTSTRPSAATYGFVLECWIGEPVTREKFIVRTTFYNSRVNEANGPNKWVSLKPQFLSVLDTGVFTSTAAKP